MKKLLLISAFLLSCGSLWAQNNLLKTTLDELNRGKTHKYEIQLRSLPKNSGFVIRYPKSWKPMLKSKRTPYNNGEASMLTLCSEKNVCIDDLNTEEKRKQWAGYFDGQYLFSGDFSIDSGERAAYVFVYRPDGSIFAMITVCIGDKSINSSLIIHIDQDSEEDLLTYVNGYKEAAELMFKKIENKNK